VPPAFPLGQHVGSSLGAHTVLRPDALGILIAEHALIVGRYLLQQVTRASLRSVYLALRMYDELQMTVLVLWGWVRY